jgi:hypothetical protein
MLQQKLAQRWAHIDPGHRVFLGILAIGGSLIAVLALVFGANNLVEIPWRLPPMGQSFADLRNLTGAGDSLRQGYDPLYFNPGDPWQRPLNHPRLLQYLIRAGQWGSTDTDWLGWCLAGLALLGPLLAFPRLDRPSAIAIGLLYFSPAIVLGLERGNHDLGIYFLVCLALGLRRSLVASMGLLGLATAIKLFPIFGLLYGLRYRRGWVVIAGFMGCFLLYMGLNAGDLPQIFASTQKGHFLWAYGIRAFDVEAPVGTYIPMGAMVLAIWLFYQAGPALPLPVQGPAVDGFRLGAGIYLGTFLLGNNWAYRLIFLLLTIPQLVAWSREASPRQRIAQVALGMIVVSCCASWIASGIIDEVANWLLFYCLLYLGLGTMPRLNTHKNTAHLNFPEVRRED